MKKMMLTQISNFLDKHQGFSHRLSQLNREISDKWIKWLNFNGSYTFINRSKGSKRLLIILAGYKDFLYPLTLSRIARFAPPDLDVCIVSSGLYSVSLEKLAETHNWSYLYTKTNRISLVQNLAISVHTQAQWIYKVDEDVFISEGFFDSLQAGYLQVKEEGLYNPGFCAPVINVNGYSYITFLRAIAADTKYKEKFGELRYASSKVNYDGEVAKWLWEKSLPFDKVASQIASEPFTYSPVPHRFSIGAILFERELWQAIGGLRAGLRNPGLGLDEEYLCKDCIEMARPIVVINNVFAGHFSFGPQESAMKEYLPEIYSQLSVKESETEILQNKADILTHW